MGADIHCYVEYKVTTPHGESWWSYGSRVNPGRDYGLFGYIAGVRYEEAPTPIPPRGYPKDLGFWARIDLFIRISNSEDADDSEGTCSPETAVSWGGKIVEDNGNRFTENPDYHSHTWLTTEELAMIIGLHEGVEEHGEVGVEYHALLGSMKALEARGHPARVVIWFDN